MQTIPGGFNSWYVDSVVVSKRVRTFLYMGMGARVLFVPRTFIPQGFPCHVSVMCI
jgi:hypothetical protein